MNVPLTWRIKQLYDIQNVQNHPIHLMWNMCSHLHAMVTRFIHYVLKTTKVCLELNLHYPS